MPHVRYYNTAIVSWSSTSWKFKCTQFSLHEKMHFVSIKHKTFNSRPMGWILLTGEQIINLLARHLKSPMCYTENSL